MMAETMEGFEAEVNRRKSKAVQKTRKSVLKAEFFKEEEDLKLEGKPICCEWCPEADLNHRHADFQSAALPTELSGHPCQLPVEAAGRLVSPRKRAGL
jgi:hypothetical protein